MLELIICNNLLNSSTADHELLSSVSHSSTVCQQCTVRTMAIVGLRLFTSGFIVVKLLILYISLSGLCDFLHTQCPATSIVALSVLSWTGNYYSTECSPVEEERRGDWGRHPWDCWSKWGKSELSLGLTIFCHMQWGPAKWPYIRIWLHAEFRGVWRGKGSLQ